MKLLSHPDRRVRQEAQFALTKRGAVEALRNVAQKSDNELARIHAIWALGQIFETQSKRGERRSGTLEPLLALLADPAFEIAAQSAKVLGNAHFDQSYQALVGLCVEARNPRGQFFAALALGKLGRNEAIPAILEMLRANGDRDPFLRHAGVTALVWINDLHGILAASTDKSRSVRMASLLSLRRLERPELARFLDDPDPKIVVEAARAINDADRYSALPQLAAMIDQTNRWPVFPNGSHDETDLRTPFLRRAINANFRLGDFQNARALVEFALEKAAPESTRLEALQQLSHWEKPSARDQITGLYRPLPSRDSTVAAQALKPSLTALFGQDSTAIRVMAARLAGQYRITEAEPQLIALLKNQTVPASVRVESLRSLTNFPSHFQKVLEIAEADRVEGLRIEAARLRALLNLSISTDTLLPLLEHGSIAEQQNALTIIATLNDPAADTVLAREMDHLIAEKLKPQLQLDLLEAAEKRDSSLVKEKLARYQASIQKEDDLSPFRSALFGGNAQEGKRIFHERPEAGCLRCHRIGVDGSDVGPPLTSVGSRLTREKILESILYPNKQIAPGFETTVVRLNDGVVQAGIVRNETDQELVLNSAESGLVAIKKAEIIARDRGLSGMPEGLGALFTKRDLRNLVEFLANQR